MRRGADAELAALGPVFADLEAAARAELAAEGSEPEAVSVDRAIDARYAGQSYELTVPATADWIETFHTAHLQRFGFARRDAEVEAVTLRVTARVRVARPASPRLEVADTPSVDTRTTPVYLAGAWHDVPLHVRRALRAGRRITGPAVIGEYSATTYVPPEWLAEVGPFGDLLLAPAS